MGACWGGSDDFQQGMLKRNTGETLKQIDSGEDHACALTESGKVLCWGKCANGLCDAPQDVKFSVSMCMYVCMHA